MTRCSQLPPFCVPSLAPAVMGDTGVWPGVAGHQSWSRPALIFCLDQQIAAWLYLYIFCNVLVHVHTI